MNPEHLQSRNGQITIADESLYPNFSTMDLVVSVSDETESQDMTINLVNNIVILPDFSESVGSIINTNGVDATNLASAENNLVLWLDASNIDGKDNAEAMAMRLANGQI